MSVYSRFFGSSIVQIIVNVFNSLIYSYTTVEYRLEQFTKTCSLFQPVVLRNTISVACPSRL